MRSVNAHPAPATRVVKNFDDLRSLVNEGAVTTVMLAAPDLQGRLKGKQYGADYFLDHVTENGAAVCGYVFATDWDMRALDGFAIASFDTGYGDLGVRPDAAAIHQLAWQPGTALVFAEAVTTDGQPLDVAPRQVLARQLSLLAAHGISVQTGLEAEFILYRGSYESAARTGYQRLRPLAQGSLDYALDHPPLMARFLDRLQRVLAETGLPIEANKAEGAPGQVEVTFPPGDPLGCADRHLLLKHAARTVGHDLGVAPTFMAAPATGIGSGLHIHFSLHRDEQPLFADTNGHTSEAARQAIGGLLNTLPDLALLWAPTVNSYKRLVPGTFAPPHPHLGL
jgi:glutamine synthetase